MLHRNAVYQLRFKKILDFPIRLSMLNKNPKTRSGAKSQGRRAMVAQKVVLYVLVAFLVGAFFFLLTVVYLWIY
jgi:hypothetical protein